MRIVAAVLISLISRGAIAKTPPKSPTTDVGEVIITAEKRPEKLERTPVAVSVFNHGERDTLGIESIQDLASHTPGFEYSASLDRAFIRGIGRQSDDVAIDPGVATYSDGVYDSSIVAASGGSLLIDHVEILRGPQGTLYGRNAVGGTVNSISRRPSDHLYAELRLTEANYQTTNIEAAISGPVNERLRLRLAGYYDDQREGYFRNLAGGPSEGGRGRTYYIEAQAAVDIAPNLSLWVKAGRYGLDRSPRTGNDVGSYDYAPFFSGIPTPGAAYGFTLPGFTELGQQTINPGAVNIRDFSTNTPFRQRLPRDYLGAAQLTWRMPWGVDLKYIGGYTTYRVVGQGDADNTSVTSYQFPTVAGGPCGGPCPPLTVYPTVVASSGENKSYFSNEINLSSDTDSRLQWIFGLYEYHEQYDQPTEVRFPDQPQLATPFGAPANPDRSIYQTDLNMGEDSFAGFGEADWRVTNAFKLTGGMRLSRDSKSGAESIRVFCFGIPDCVPAGVYGAYTPALDITEGVISHAPSPGVAGPPSLDPATGAWSRRLRASWSALTGTAGAEWTPTPDFMAYAKYSRGYKSGGFNAGAILPQPETGAEFLDSWEIGSKSVIARRLQVNAAIFYYLYHGMQIPLAVQPPSGPPQTQIVNLNRVVAYGVEMETTWQVTHDLRLIFNYAYLHAGIARSSAFEDDVQPGLGNQRVDGATIPEAPRNKLSIDASYTRHFAAGALTLSGSYVWKDRTWYAIFNRPWYLAPTYGQVDLRLLWNDAKDRYTVIAYVKNLTDAQAYDNVGASLLTQPAPGSLPYDKQFGLLPPRLYGLELQYRFQ